MARAEINLRREYASSKALGTGDERIAFKAGFNDGSTVIREV